MFFFNTHMGLSTIIGMVGAFFIFKIPYVKLHPINSLITIGFVFGLMFVAFPKSS